MKIKLILTLILLNGISANAATLFEKLCEYNPNWKRYEKFVPTQETAGFSSERVYIQTHLKYVLQILNSADLSRLDRRQLKSRARLMKALTRYREEGLFPQNFYKNERIPVFIDELGTHCAVGFLMKESGFGELALTISKEDNYIWVKDLQKREVLEWQQQSGFTLNELKLIQGAYDSYMPFALEAVNRVEIPQKPEVMTHYFDLKDLVRSNSKADEKAIWIRGEGINGILNGRWEQNFSPTIPWIVGHYKDGKRTGRWLEYYRGTKNLCRTEYWENDQLNGIRTRFDEDGNVIERIEFKDGKAILKTNYESSTQLKYVRKPLEDNKVYTEIYDLLGSLVARGTERIHNPGNLQWFQNIELTALNTMSIASQSVSNNGLNSSSNSVNYYNTPPLVDYIKESDWVYYTDFNEKNTEMDVQKSNLELFSQRFNRFGKELYYATQNIGGQTVVPEFDSIAVTYYDGNIQRFDGYFGGQKINRLKFEIQPASIAGFDSRGRYGRTLIFLQGIRYGQVNEKEERIGKWVTYDENGQLIKVEEFILPEKKTVIQTN